MRIAVTGTHSVGKSTFVADWVAARPEYTHEPEPYRALRDFYDIKFGQESTRYHNGLQLLYNVGRVKSYTSPRDCVIFDRAPPDYIAYSAYTAHYHQTDINQAYVESMIAPVREALSWIDVLVYIPITDQHLVNIENDGIRLVDPAYRSEVDDVFKRLYRKGLYGLLPKERPPLLIEIYGPREERIRQLAAVVDCRPAPVELTP